MQLFSGAKNNIAAGADKRVPPYLKYLRLNWFGVKPTEGGKRGEGER